MREIKFRFWDKQQNQLIDNYLISIDGNGRISYSHGNVVGGDGVNGEKFIIQQFIGLKDKNGKEIYEGDIVKYTEKMCEHGDIQELIGTVIYDNKTASFGLDKEEIWNYFTDMTIKNFEIIGNIFENPELLNKN